jgi:beta-lactamase class A
MKKIFLAIFLIGLGFAGGFYLHSNSQKTNSPQTSANVDIRSNSGLYKYINALLECDTESILGFDQLKPINTDIQKVIYLAKSTGKIADAAVYFRSLDHGAWFGITETTNYFPASLLKVPLMMAYLKDSETDPSILQKEILYDKNTADTLGDFNNGTYYKSEKAIQVGKKYTVSDLINRSIIYSDNNAKNLLVLNLPNVQDLFRVYTELGIATPMELRGTGNIVSVQEYATFFRILYNASFLSYDDSEKALEILAQTKFDKGLRAGVPANIEIAHKFGEYEDNGVNQLHDCGIVYYPHEPYLLCIMTRGNNIDDLANTIKDISATAYEDVDSTMKK